MKKKRPKYLEKLFSSILLPTIEQQFETPQLPFLPMNEFLRSYTQFRQETELNNGRILLPKTRKRSWTFI